MGGRSLPRWPPLFVLGTSYPHSSEVLAAIQENLEELATLESLDNGKPYVIAKTVDVPMVYSHHMPYFIAHSFYQSVEFSSIRHGPPHQIVPGSSKELPPVGLILCCSAHDKAAPSAMPRPCYCVCAVHRAPTLLCRLG